MTKKSPSSFLKKSKKASKLNSDLEGLTYLKDGKDNGSTTKNRKALQSARPQKLTKQQQLEAYVRIVQTIKMDPNEQEY